MEFDEPGIPNIWSDRFDIDQISNLVSARLSRRILEQEKPKESPVPKLNLNFLNKNVKKY